MEFVCTLHVLEMDQIGGVKKRGWWSSYVRIIALHWCAIPQDFKYPFVTSSSLVRVVRVHFRRYPRGVSITQKPYSSFRCVQGHRITIISMYTYETTFLIMQRRLHIFLLSFFCRDRGSAASRSRYNFPWHCLAIEIFLPLSVAPKLFLWHPFQSVKGNPSRHRFNPGCPLVFASLHLHHRSTFSWWDVSQLTHGPL